MVAVAVKQSFSFSRIFKNMEMNLKLAGAPESLASSSDSRMSSSNCWSNWQ